MFARIPDTVESLNESMTSEAILVDLMDNVDKNVKFKGRNSFYSLPKTLSEDDDPFGVFQTSSRGGPAPASVTEDLMVTSEEPSTGLLVHIEPDSPKIHPTISESFNSIGSR